MCTVAGCSHDNQQIMWTYSSLAHLVGRCIPLGCSGQPALTMAKISSFSGGNGNGGDALEVEPVKQQQQMDCVNLCSRQWDGGRVGEAGKKPLKE